MAKMDLLQVRRKFGAAKKMGTKAARTDKRKVTTTELDEDR